MAQFEMQLPDDIIKDIATINKDFEKIFGGMTKAGAKEVKKRVEGNLPNGLKQSKNFKKCLKLSRVYRTPTDDGINTKVLISGYFINSDGRKTPAPLVANVFEYGRSGNKFPKQPFFRKSFDNQAITKVMLEEQKKLSGGLLDE